MALTLQDKARVISELDNGVWVGNARWDDFKINNYEAISLCNLLTEGDIKEVSSRGSESIEELFKDVLTIADINEQDQDVDSLVKFIEHV